MKIIAIDQKFDTYEGDILFIPILVNDADILVELDKKFAGNLRDELVATHFSAEFGEELWLDSIKKKKYKACLLGVGEKEKFDPEVARRWAGKAVKLAKSKGGKEVGFWLAKLTSGNDIVQAIAEGAWLSDYRFLRYRKEEGQKEKNKAIKSISLIVGGNTVKAEKSIKEAAVGVLGTIFARDLVNEPSNHLRPSDLAREAMTIADNSGRIQLGILGRKELQENGFGAFLAVAQGSVEEPYLVHLIYRGTKKPKKRIALVGKGITFDAGGISLKPADKIMDMKADMAGAATVLGVFRSLALIDLPLEIHGLVAACENMPGARATKPGDVIKSYSGKTIEVLNTDAEGRLVLADALSYAAKEIMPDTIVDFATLTGACLVALGEYIAGFTTLSDELSSSLMQASLLSGEGLWRLPLARDYHDKMDSDIADIKNITDDKYAGTIMGGMFLQEFVPEAIEFAHIDIAGPAYDEKGKIDYIPKGGTGFGIRLTLAWLKSLIV